MEVQDGGPSDRQRKCIDVYPSTRPTNTQTTLTQTIGTQPTGMSKEVWEKLDRRTRSMI
jgi:hypothetical protein